MRWAVAVLWVLVSLAQSLQATSPGVAYTKRKGAGPLFRIVEETEFGKAPCWLGQRWGYMDRTGRVAIPPQFCAAGDFFSGRARVLTANGWGYIDESGRIVIPGRFNYALDFLEGLAPVLVKRLWGYIDTDGRFVVPPQFQGAAEFHEGLARVLLWSTGTCNNRGVKTTVSSTTAPMDIFMLDNLRQAQLVSCHPTDARVGYIDSNGEFLVPPGRYAGAADFSEGLAAVFNEHLRKFGYIDRTGTLVIPFRFDGASDFSEGLASVRVGYSKIAGITDPGSYGYIDRIGKFAIPPQFASAGPFSEGLAAVHFRNPDYSAFINATGRVLRIPFSSAMPFSEGITTIHDASLESSNYRDREGKVVFTEWNPLGEFSDGLAVARRGAAEMYINLNGQPVGLFRRPRRIRR